MPGCVLSHGAEHGEFVGDGGLHGEQFSELHAGDFGVDGGKGSAVFGSCVGLGVVGIDVRTAAWFPDHDDGSAVGIGWPAGAVGSGGRGTDFQQSGETEAGEAGKSHPKEAATSGSTESGRTRADIGSKKRIAHGASAGLTRMEMGSVMTISTVSGAERDRRPLCGRLRRL
jgi:hypothetical protein